MNPARAVPRSHHKSLQGHPSPSPGKDKGPPQPTVHVPWERAASVLRRVGPQ